MRLNGITNHPIDWNNNSLHRSDADQLIENLHNCYNLYANTQGKLSLDEFKTKLNQILDDAVSELNEAHKKKKENEETTFSQEESKMWRQATAIGPPDKLETLTFSKGEACLAPTNQRKTKINKQKQPNIPTQTRTKSTKSKNPQKSSITTPKTIK